MPDLMVCVACRDDENRKPFIVPHDEHGVAIMTEHLRQEHGYDL